MSETTRRVLHLLGLLQSADLRTVAELADRLEVDERTVRRYASQLIEMDIPVETVRGRHGGYRLARGFRTLPIVLSDDEALAAAVGLLGASGAVHASPLAARTALSKLRRVLPAAAADRVDALLATATFADAPDAESPDASVLLTVAEAIRARTPLDLRYRDAEGIPSRRAVRPYDLVARSGRWYLIALDVARNAERTFRADRIATARPLPGTFVSPQRPDPAALLVDGFANADYAWNVILRIHADEERIRARLPAAVATLERIDRPGDGSWHRARIRAERLDWLPSVILALDVEVIVEEPEELVGVLRDSAARLLRAAAGTV